jgi:hypothetical protein
MIKRYFSLSLGTLVLLSGNVFSSEYPIGGSTPDMRPQGAPVITTINKDNDWYKRALTGVVSPYPNSLSFLEDQGNWYTPFTRPGMLGVYDIRNMHSTQ